MPFPEIKYKDISTFKNSYFENLCHAYKSIDDNKLTQAAALLTEIYTKGGFVYSCGNGGSAAIANHLVCDHSKLVRTDTHLSSRIVSLSSTVEIITAIGNDISYDDIFVYQLSCLAKQGDALITVSSSGNSENIVKAAQWAKDNKIPVIALTGFEGGRSSQIADINIHVSSNNYGIVEDTHQSIMHILAQYIRMAHMQEELIKSRKF